jgi:hypothetical protein
MTLRDVSNNIRGGYSVVTYAAGLGSSVGIVTDYGLDGLSKTGYCTRNLHMTQNKVC